MALRFQPGGTLKEGSFYVERPADMELPEALSQGEFCYVLAPRQIGKSSLRVRTAKLLQSKGIRCAGIDLTKIGSQELNPDSWFYALTQEVAMQLNLARDPWEFWKKLEATTPTHRFTQFLRSEVLSQILGKVVLFIDEIDTVLSLPFSSDDFFAAIRAVYNDRAEDPQLERLTFCLVGVAAPGDLIRNPTRTPFNIGKGIILEDFLPKEAACFLPGLLDAGGDPDRLLAAVLYWTDGHPYMTQRICEALTHDQSRDREEERVERIVESVFLRDGRNREPNLTYAESRLRNHPQLGPLLSVYRNLLQGIPILAERDDPIQMELHLAGLVARRNIDGKSQLAVRNRIFATVYDLNWVRSKESRRMLDEPLLRWLASSKQSDFLLRGAALKQSLDWSRGRRDITDEEREFLLAGLEMAQQEEAERRQAAEEKNRAERAEAQARARRQIIIVLSAALGFLFLALMGVASQYLRAEQQRQLAEDSALAERGLRAAVIAKQPGRQIEALVSGLTVVGSSLHEKWGARSLSPTAIEGLLTATRAGVYSRVLSGHNDEIRSAQFSPSGEYVVSASIDRTARIWDVRTGQTVRILRGHSAGIRWAAYSPSGKHIVTAAQDHTVRIWNAATGVEIRTLLGHTDEVRSATYSPDGKYVLTASADRTARIWDAETGNELRKLVSHTLGVLSAVYSSDGKKILTAGMDQTARIWDVETGNILLVLEGHANAIRSAAFSPDGKYIVTASYDNTARLCSAETGKSVFTLEGHSSELRTAVYSPDGKNILTASLDQTARIWDAETGKLLTSLEGHKSGVRSASYSPDGMLIVTASYDNTVRIWDIHRGRALVSLDAHTNPVRSAMFSPDGMEILTASSDHSARVWNAKTALVRLTLRGHKDAVRWASYSGDGKKIVTASFDKTVRIWEASTGELIRTLIGHTGGVLFAEFSQDGKRVVTAADDYSARIWNAETGEQTAILTGHTMGVQSAAFSLDGKRVVTASLDHLAKVWDAQTGACLLSIQGSTKRLLNATFSPDGKHVATSSDDNTAHIWDSRTGASVASLVGHGNGVRSVAYSKDGKYLVTASYDNTAKIWNASNGNILLTLEGHTNGINAASFSPNGKWVVTASSDRSAKVHPASVSDYFLIACNLLRYDTEFEKVRTVCSPLLGKWP
ncbi:MAG TPA: AAA-like domain-containing protein [Pseudomonadota bacterium]|nr:AAA-like domain-containing protein [Pseudomonadota bacterium]